MYPGHVRVFIFIVIIFIFAVIDSRMCPLGVYYDADVHDALANLRKLDGDIPVHPQYGMSVNCFALKNRVNTGPSPLPLNWGTSFRTI